MKKTFRSLCLLTLAVPFCGHAARWFVSGTGSDANACTRSAPCATFQQVVSSIAASGDEIDAIDAGDFGTVVIGKSITIDGGSDGFAEDVFVSSGSVIVRNLSIVSAFTAVDVGGSATLRLEHVSILGSPNYGIFCTNSAVVVLDDVHITNAHLTGVGAAVFATNGAKVSLSNSVLASSDTGITALNGAIVQVDNCIIRLNTLGVYLPSAATVRLSNTTVTDNGTGLSQANGASIVTFGNNRIYGNEAKVNPATGNPTISVSVR